MLPLHFESTERVETAPATLFAHLDHHDRLTGHMSQSSWMMAGGKMQIAMDDLKGRGVGATIRISGRVLGVLLSAEEVVTEHEPPFRKAWATVGDVRLLVIGPYRMGFDIAEDGSLSRLRVFIDYALPARGISRWLGRLFGGWYARWCTRRMVLDAVQTFRRSSGESVESGRTISTYALMACGIWLIGLGLYFLILRPPLLPEDFRYLGTSQVEIQAAVPGLARWARRVFTVMGGFMAGAGVLTISVAMNASAGRTKWTWIALALAGLFTVGTMSVVNFQLNSDFKWLLLIPSLLWVIGLVFPSVVSRWNGSR